MKALIDGKIYDTEKADLICTLDEGREAIYLTKKKRWFSYIDGEYESINPLAPDHALEKMSAYYDDESVKAAIHKHFADDIEEA